MKHHPKSNNGVFSKKQIKASRMMMRTRGTEVHSQRKYDASLLGNESAVMSKAMAMLSAAKRLFRANREA